MRKQITLLICLVALCMAMFCPLSVQAATPLDPTADISLTLHYQKEEQAFGELSISIYRVAEAFPDGTFELIEPFSSYPINIHDITMQEQWKNTAVTLSSYIVANQLMPYREATTNDVGTAVFEYLETLCPLSDSAGSDLPFRRDPTAPLPVRKGDGIPSDKGQAETILAGFVFS